MSKDKQTNEEKIQMMKNQQRELEINIFKLQGAIEMLTTIEKEKSNGNKK